MQYLYDQLKASKGSSGPLAGVMFWNAVLSSQWDTDGYGIRLDSHVTAAEQPAPAGPAGPAPKPAAAVAGRKATATVVPSTQQPRTAADDEPAAADADDEAAGRRRLVWVQEKLDSFRRAQVGRRRCKADACQRLSKARSTLHPAHPTRWAALLCMQWRHDCAKRAAHTWRPAYGNQTQETLQLVARYRQMTSGQDEAKMAAAAAAALAA